METFHFELYLSKLHSLLNIVSACNQFRDTNIGAMIADALQRLILITDTNDIPASAKMEAQMAFISVLENLHMHHRTVQTNYYLTEFRSILELSGPSIDLRKVQ